MGTAVGTLSCLLLLRHQALTPGGMHVCVFGTPFGQVQLVRIQMRVPEYGWTTQKVFHLLNAVVSSTRAVAFFFIKSLTTALPHPLVLRLFLYDLPGAPFRPGNVLWALFLCFGGTKLRSNFLMDHASGDPPLVLSAAVHPHAQT